LAPTQAKKNKRSNAIIPDTIISDDVTSKCTLSCLNDGHCTFVEYFDYPIKGDSGYYQACACPSNFHGGQCELSVQETEMRITTNKAKTGASISITICVLIVGMALFMRRRKRQRNFRQGSEEKFHSMYLDNLARDLGNLGRDKGDSDDEGSSEEVEFDRQDTRASLDSIENGVDAEYL
jgi:hypothetical protein